MSALSKTKSNKPTRRPLVTRLTRRNENGLSAVESALVLPLVMLLVLGIIEGALLFRTFLSAGNGAEGGARIGSIDGNETYSDYDVLQAVVKDSPGANKGQISEVIVYKATASGAGPSTQCINNALSDTGVGITNVCNVYTAADLLRPQSDFGPNGTGRDQYWPAVNRSLSLSAGTDFLGVWIHMQCQCMAQTIFGRAPDFHATSVVQLEASEA